MDQPAAGSPSWHSLKVTIPWDKPRGIQCMPSGFTPVVIDPRPSMKVTIPWDKPGGIQCMPSGFTLVVIDLRPSMKVMIPWDKPRGIQCMPSGFTPVVIDLRPSMKVTIPWGKPKGIQCLYSFQKCKQTTEPEAYKSGLFPSSPDPLSPKRGEGEKTRWGQANPLGCRG